MRLGLLPSDSQMISELVLYNETLENFDLSMNELSKVRKIFMELVRNRLSNLMELDLSSNQIDIDEFIALLKIIEVESSFGHLHFKLRFLNLVNNPMKDFDFKVQRKLKEYYERSQQKLFIIANDYQTIPDTKF